LPTPIRNDECDFAGLDLSGADKDYSLFIFNQIDGRDANFDNVDASPAIFARSCLQRATFRGANLRGADFREACLVGADFTGATTDLGAPGILRGVLCHTIMPDGSINNRDCGTDKPCCQT
jgi:uncharacterized protein YjbI with pentapeptide repeats